MPSGRSIRLFAAPLCLISLSLLGACSEEEGTADSPEAPARPAVAHVANGAITVQEFRHYLAERASTGATGTAREWMDDRLEEAILEELLYQEALRLQLDEDPVVRRRVRQLLVRALLDEEVNRKSWEREISDEEILAYYETRRDEFRRPEQVRVADLFIAVPALASEEEKAAAKATATSLLAEAMATKARRNGFGRLIEAHSDTPAGYRRGDTGFFDANGNPIGLDRNLVRAAFELPRNGDIFEEVVETADGYHVIMRIGKRSAVDRPLEQVRGQLEQRIRREGQEQARKAYFARLREGAEIRIDEEALARVARDLEEDRNRPGLSRERRSPSRRERADGPPRLPE